jgi:hypothetical protein
LSPCRCTDIEIGGAAMKAVSRFLGAMLLGAVTLFAVQWGQRRRVASAA